MTRRISVVALTALCVVGCSSNPQGVDQSPQIVATLREVGELLRTEGRPPTKVADLERGRTLYPGGYEAVKSGEVVVLWGASLGGEGEAAKGGGSVVAHEKDAPANGGYVLLTSGEVKKMTADEFKAAPKAKK